MYPVRRSSQVLRRRTQDELPPPPLLIIAATLRKGLFYLSGAGLTAILGGSFIVTLTPLAIVAGISTSLLLGSVGVILRLLEYSYWPGDNDD